MTDDLNPRALAILEQATKQAGALRIASHRAGRLVDFGVQVRGGLQAGLELATICMGGLGHLQLVPDSGDAPAAVRVQVHTDQPALACMGSQYGGWPVKTGDFFAIGSGPGRLKRGQEKVLKHYGWSAGPESVVLVLECGGLPDESVIDYMAGECGLAAEQLFVCVASTGSLAGTLQIVARSVEATMHKLYELDVDLRCVTSGWGSAPLPPVSADDLTAIGRTNDAILYGGDVMLWVDLSDEEIRELGPRVPSNSSGDYGKPFGEIFAASGGDFYKLDPLLFSAARITLVSNVTGNSFRFGSLDHGILARSFGLESS